MMYELFDTIKVIKLSYNGSDHTPSPRPSCVIADLVCCEFLLISQRSGDYLPVIVLRTWFMPHSEIELLFSKRIAPFQIHCAVITRSMEAKFLIESNGLFSSVIYAGEEVQVLWPEDGNKPATADSSDKLKTTGWKIKGGISEQHCNISSPSVIFQAQNCGERSHIIMTKEHQVSADCKFWGGQFSPDDGRHLAFYRAVMVITPCPRPGNWMSPLSSAPRHYPGPGEPWWAITSAGCFSF